MIGIVLARSLRAIRDSALSFCLILGLCLFDPFEETFKCLLHLTPRKPRPVKLNDMPHLVLTALRKPSRTNGCLALPRQDYSPSVHVYVTVPGIHGAGLFRCYDCWLIYELDCADRSMFTLPFRDDFHNSIKVSSLRRAYFVVSAIVSFQTRTARPSEVLQPADGLRVNDAPSGAQGQRTKLPSRPRVLLR